MRVVILYMEGKIALSLLRYLILKQYSVCKNLKIVCFLHAHSHKGVVNNPKSI
jgi:hypothetical protein